MEQLANEPGFRYTMDQFKLIQQIGSGAYGKVLSLALAPRLALLTQQFHE
jgi:hypothetical protein